MDRDAKLRVGVVGVSGYLARVALPSLVAAPSCELVCVGARDVETAAAKLGDLASRVEILPSFAGAIEHPEVDAVYVCLPNGLHAEFAERALAAHRHVLCEKPMSLREDEAERMFATADEHGMVLIEGYMYRFHPRWLRMRELLASGRLGRPRSVVAHYAYLDDEFDGPRFRPELDGGAQAMIGCYPVSVANLAFGTRPRAVRAVQRDAPGSTTDMTASALLEYDDGHAVTHASVEVFDSQYVRILGSEGIVEMDWPFNPGSGDETSLQLSDAAGTHVERFPAADQFLAEYEQFAAVVKGGGGATPIARSESLDLAATLEALRRSALGGGERVELAS